MAWDSCKVDWTDTSPPATTRPSAYRGIQGALDSPNHQCAYKYQAIPLFALLFSLSLSPSSRFIAISSFSSRFVISCTSHPLSGLDFECRACLCGHPAPRLLSHERPRMFGRNVSRSQTESFSKRSRSTKAKSGSFREHAVSKSRHDRPRKPPTEEGLQSGR